MSGLETSDRRHGSSFRRSTISRMGQPARSSLRVGVETRSPAQSSAARVGTGDTSRQGAPARRARSTATSRACQVGARSSCSASSCSSRTTTAPMSGIGAQAAARAPTTTSTPPAAAAQSRGHDRHGQAGAAEAGAQQPGLVDRRRHDEGRAGRRGGQDDRDRVGARRPAHHPSARRPAGGPAPASTGPGRPAVTAGAGSAGTARGGDAASRKGRRRAGRPPARRPRRQVDQLGRRAVPGDLGQGPQLGGRHVRIGRSDRNHPAPTRRPARPTRTIVPARTVPAPAVGHQVVELLVEPRDVRDHPRHQRRPRITHLRGSAPVHQTGASGEPVRPARPAHRTDARRIAERSE